MADDDGSGETSDGKGAGRKGEPSHKRVELVDPGDPSTAGLPGYIGVGLLGGFVLGFGPLRDAVQGNGPFEEAMLRFVACLLVCVAAASVLGRLLDNAEGDEPEARPDEPERRASVDDGRIDDGDVDRATEAGST